MRRQTIGSAEFIVIISVLMSIAALATDAILPALGIIGADLRLSDLNRTQHVVTSVFMGMAIGQLIFGPYSDARGRKEALYVGLMFFIAGSFICYFSNQLSVLLSGRLVQGFGVAGPYVVAISIVRDRHVGREMAKIMSIVMLIFFMVPAIAPGIGQIIISTSSWKNIFTCYAIYALLIISWIALRLDETLPFERRIPFSIGRLRKGASIVLSNRTTVLNTVCIGLFYGGFIGYLNSSQQIFQVQFAAGDLFSVYFGLLAFTLGIASIINSRLVGKFGMAKMCNISNIGVLIASAMMALVIVTVDVNLKIFMIYASVLFFFFGFMFGNLNAMAMEPMGEIAGTAAAIIGFFSSVIAISIGTLLGQLYDGTLMPLTLGLLTVSLLSFAILSTIQRRQNIGTAASVVAERDGTPITGSQTESASPSRESKR